MEIWFDDEQVARLCSARAEMDSFLGERAGRRLRSRLGMLLAAPTLADVPSDPPDGLKACRVRSGEYSVAIEGEQRLHFRASPSDRVNMDAVQSIEIISIGGRD